LIQIPNPACIPFYALQHVAQILNAKEEVVVRASSDLAPIIALCAGLPTAHHPQSQIPPDKNTLSSTNGNTLVTPIRSEIKGLLPSGNGTKRSPKTTLRALFTCRHDSATFPDFRDLREFISACP
jgi:hypothetical protein